MRKDLDIWRGGLRSWGLVSLGLLALSVGCSAAPDGRVPSSRQTDVAAAESQKSYCDAIQKLEFSDGTLVDDNGDGVWDPGESAVVALTVTNTGADCHVVTAYPEMRFLIDPPVVDVFTGLGPDKNVVSSDCPHVGASLRVHYRLVAQSDVAPGTDIMIWAAMTDRFWPFDHCRNDGPATYLQTTIGSALR